MNSLAGNHVPNKARVLKFETLFVFIGVTSGTLYAIYTPHMPAACVAAREAPDGLACMHASGKPKETAHVYPDRSGASAAVSGEVARTGTGRDYVRCNQIVTPGGHVGVHVALRSLGSHLGCLVRAHNSCERFFAKHLFPKQLYG